MPRAQHAPLPTGMILLALLSLLLVGAIFGFFYAWVCSTMWGLDAADPAVAIAAMQAMNASVRNAAFAPAFFGTPVVLILTALVARAQDRSRSAAAFLGAGLVYLLGGLVLTMVVNVPMNEALALVVIPQDVAAAQQIWTEYSGTWQVWNTARTVASAVAVVLTGLALMLLNEVND
ncbi:anthrone oxygenase family protein [Yoonia sp. F2084L]|uniref:anthrone oxygenase family protein n=1 Tax=Yoonia sp. F2084L TaxID=2926419 RepID=UPI001FF43176|nr:anthrone oxygenase family protein [Yoonia sp. F2084L]